MPRPLSALQTTNSLSSYRARGGFRPSILPAILYGYETDPHRGLGRSDRAKFAKCFWGGKLKRGHAETRNNAIGKEAIWEMGR